MESSKALVCLFLDGVLCSYRKGKNKKLTMMNRCFTCVHYQRFVREMDEEDARVMAEIDEIRNHGYEYVDRKRSWKNRSLRRGV